MRNEIEKRISFFDLLVFSDSIDKCLLILGTICAIFAGGSFPLLYVIYSQALTILVELEAYKIHENTTSDALKCLMPKNSSINGLEESLDTNMYSYIFLGFSSVILFYLAYICWNISCERQIRRLRDVEKIKSAIDFKFPDFIIMTFRGFGCAIFAMIVLWEFSIVFLSLIPFMVVPSILATCMLRNYNMAKQIANEASNKIVQEVLSSLKIIYAYGMEFKWIEKYWKSLQSAESISKRKGLLSGILGGFSIQIYHLLFAVLMYYGVYLFHFDCYKYSPANIITPFMALASVGFFLSQAIFYFKHLEEAKEAARRVFSLIDWKNQHKPDLKQLKIVNQKENKDKKTGELIPEKTDLFEIERKLISYHKPETLWLVCGTFCRILNELNYITVYVIFFEIFSIFMIDDKVEQTNLSIRYAAILVAISFVNFFALIFSNYSFALCGARLTKKIKSRMFESLLRQEMGFYDLEENEISKIAAQLSDCPRFCKRLTSNRLSLFVQSLSGFGVGFVICAIFSLKLTIVMLIFVPFCFVNGAFGGRISSSNLCHVERFYEVKSERKSIKRLGLFHLRGLLYALSNCLFFFIQATVFRYGYYLIETGDINLTNLYRVYIIITFTSMELGRIFSLTPDYKRSINAAKTVFKIIDRKSKIDSLSQDGLAPANVIGNIRLENVYFSYPRRPDHAVLRGLNLEIYGGESNALVGSYECGKSTTISLLLRLYDVDSGAIYLDGVDIRKINVRWLRSKMALVSQEPVLFDTTIHENISLGDVSRDNVDLSEVIRCAIQSNIHQKIETLQEGYETILGSQLSKGEKQRIAIARALIRRPRILLVDEATTSLDSASEQIVQDALNRAQIGRTCIVVAHKLSTIQNSNKISVIIEGKSVEEGTHSDLMNLNGFYYRLYQNN